MEPRAVTARRLLRSQLPRLALASPSAARARARGESLALPVVDVLFGNEEDFSAALGFELEGVDETFSDLRTASFRKMIGSVVGDIPNITTVATTLRTAHSASVNGWGAICYSRRAVSRGARSRCRNHRPRGRRRLVRIGPHLRLLSGKDPQWALECGVAHGALAMSTPGDTTMAPCPKFCER